MLLVASLALIQITLLQLPLGFALPLLLVLVICRALVAIGSAFPDRGIIEALRWACYGGLVLDLFSAMPLGSHVLALVLAILLVAGATRSLQIEGVPLPILSVLAGAIVYEVTLAAVYRLQAVAIEWQHYWLMVITPNVLVALIPAPPVFFVMRRLLRGA